jgi:hypothetical protein
LQQYYERVQAQAEVLDNILVDIAFAPIETKVATAKGRGANPDDVDRVEAKN